MSLRNLQALQDEGDARAKEDLIRNIMLSIPYTNDVIDTGLMEMYKKIFSKTSYSKCVIVRNHMYFTRKG